MIFIRALLTTTIGQCQVRAWNTKLATVGLYEPVMRLNADNCLSMRFIAHNEIHGPLGASYNPERVRQRLRDPMQFSNTNYSPQILAPTWTINLMWLPFYFWAIPT